jgi:hypothetical protein
MKVTKLSSPPYVVDTRMLTQFDARHTVFGRVEWDEEASFYGRGIYDGALEVLARNEPGRSRIEFARAQAAWTVSDHFQGAYSWTKLGEPDQVMARAGKHPVSSPEEMSREMKEAAKIYGADLVGICELDRRWVYTHERDGCAVEIPPDYRYAVVMAIAMDPQGIKASPEYASAVAVGVGYSRMAFTIACMAEFIRHLGYQAIPMGNTTALSIPLAIDAGLGELGRNGLLVTPEYGPCVRLCKVFTDLSLTSDRPIAFGLGDACADCRKCANACAVRAISTDPVPSFEVACRSNNPGVLRWHVHHDRCYGFWTENGQDCASCIAACPFMDRYLAKWPSAGHTSDMSS